MSLKIKIFNQTAVSFCLLMSAATYVHSAVTITFAQSGTDVTMTSSGTFNPAVCNQLSNGSASATMSLITPRDGFVHVATNNDYTICNGVSVSLPANGRGFGTGRDSFTNVQSGANFIFNPASADPLRVPRGFNNSTSFSGTITFNSTSLSSMRLETGTYVYTFTNPNNPSIQDTFTVVVPVMNSAPTATPVSIAGTVQAGSTLTGSYTYTDADSDAEGTSTLRWVRNNTRTSVAGGTNVGTSTTYTPVADDVNWILYYCVTPVAAAGVTTGTEVCSAATRPVEAAPVPTAIPTLSEWAMILMASLMGLFAFTRIRRQS